MKRYFLSAVVLFLLAGTASAQAKKATVINKKPQNKNITGTNKSMNSRQANTSAWTTARSSGNYGAKANPPSLSAAAHYTIADPTLRALNERAAGGDVKISNSGIVGMPKRAYGFANGHITLFSTGTTSSGTMTGSGAVGTGSSLGSIGSSGPAMGINGKSPYAGSSMWGNARGLWIRKGDSTVRQAGTKKDQ